MIEKFENGCISNVHIYHLKKFVKKSQKCVTMFIVYADGKMLKCSLKSLHCCSAVTSKPALLVLDFFS